MNDSHKPDSPGSAAGNPTRTIDVPTAVRIADRYLQEGRLEQARQLCLQIVQAAPAQVDALNLLGIIAAESGAHEEAEQRFGQALRLRPDNALIHFNLGLAQAALGKVDEAIANYRAALRIDPGLTAVKINLGGLLRQRGAFVQALEVYQQAAQDEPDDPVLHNNLGNVLRDLGRHDEAVSAFTRALELKPDYFEACNNLGVAYKNQDRFDDAVRCSERALEINAGYAPAYFNIGNIHFERGDFASAAAYYRQALAHDPVWGEAHHHLAMTRTHERYDEEMQAMEAMLARPDVPDTQKMFLHFALGKSFEDIKDYDQAFPHFAEGCRLKRATYTYDIKNDVRHFAAIKEVFSPELFERHAGAGHRDPTPVFIVGMPRSGTTLVEQILASHPQVSGAGELTDLREVVTAAVQQGMTYPALATRLDSAALGRMGAEYIDRLRRRFPNAARITDKMPGNFMFIGMIRLMLPEATIIHCRRDPVDTCLSCFKHHFLHRYDMISHMYSYDLAELGQVYRLYQDLMAHWHRVLPGRIHDIEYEALIDDPEGESRRLVEHCGLPWNDACLSFHTLERTVRTASVAQVRRPIYRSSVQRWKRYETHLAPLLEALNAE